MTHSKRVAVVGGGISGLAAAHRLRELRPAWQIELLEAGRQLGGVLRTERRDGFLIEQSADMLTTREPWAVELCERIGLADELIPTVPQNRRAFVVRDGQLHPIPEGFALMSPTRMLPLLKTRLLSTRGKLRLLGERFVKPQPPASGDESLASFASRRFGPEAYAQLVQPLISGIYTADPERLSMAATMPQFLELERKWGSIMRGVLRGDQAVAREPNSSGARYGLFVAPREGMGSLVQAIARQLPSERIHLGCPVERIALRGDGRWQLDLGAPVPATFDSPHPVFDAILLATPAPVTAKLLQDVHAALAEQLQRIVYAGVAIVVLAYPREQIRFEAHGSGFVVPLAEGRRIIAGSFASNKFPGRAPDDALLLRIFVGGACQPELLERSDQDLLHLVRSELNELLGIAGEPLLADVIRWPASMPQYHVGHLQIVEQIERYARELRGIELAGNAYRGVGIPFCIRSGQQAAERLVEGD